MNSTITLYYECLVEKDRNFILDRNGNKGIETYLQTLTSSVINNFQYVKQALNLTIKIDMDQSALNMGNNAQDLNYVKIRNGNENPCYYFVASKTWRSQNTIELVLEMDTLNTYQYGVDYIIDKKTFIKRMHRDRFTKNVYSPTLVVEHDFTASGQVYGFTFNNLLIQRCKPTNLSIIIMSGNATGEVHTNVYYGTYSIAGTLTSTGAGHVVAYIDFDATDVIMRVVDLKSEEINVPTYKNYEVMLYDKKGRSDLDWSLYYKNSSNQENAPVDCYLYPSSPISINYQSSAGEITSTSINHDVYVIFSPTYPSGNLTFKCGDANYEVSKIYDTFGNEIGHKLIALIYTQGRMFVYTGMAFKGSALVYSSLEWTLVYEGNPYIVNAPQYVYAYEKATLPTAGTWFGGEEMSSYATTQISFGVLSYGIVNGKQVIDKTLSTNIKIINVPYCPTPFDMSSTRYIMDSCWTYNSNDKNLKLTDLSTKFENHIETAFPTLLDDMFIKLNSTDHDITRDRERWMKDSKLYHSDYFKYKFVYDSFTKVFPLESLNFDNYDYTFSFDFIMSRNIVSKFLFRFNQYGYKYKCTTEDFPNVLAVSRNNEEVLYSSQYLDYIRTGYNYDLKAKERQQVASGIGIGLNIAGLIASIGLSFVPGGQAIGIGGAIAGGIGLASQLVGYAKNTAQNEENIQRKLQESQMQSVSVQNSDDYDLLYAYTTNKAIMMVYSCSDRMQQVLEDLFFYCGYIINEQGIPNVSSRRSFNFLQATLEISKTNNLTNEIVSDIKEKFENGVTFLHYSFDKFDFDQDKENIELSIL